MPLFHITAEIPEFTPEVVALVEEHRAYINRLFSENKMLSYAVAATATTLWCVLKTEDEQTAMGLIADMPMQQFFADVQCTRLLFFNSQTNPLTAISLN